MVMIHVEFRSPTDHRGNWKPVGNKLKRVVAVGRKAVTRYYGTHATITMAWVCTLECGHKRVVSQLKHYVHPDRLKCEPCTERSAHA